MEKLFLKIILIFNNILSLQCIERSYIQDMYCGIFVSLVSHLTFKDSSVLVKDNPDLSKLSRLEK